eukprot:472982-Amphidinium_carterae.1
MPTRVVRALSGVKLKPSCIGTRLPLLDIGRLVCDMSGSAARRSVFSSRCHSRPCLDAFPAYWANLVRPV